MQRIALRDSDSPGHGGTRALALGFVAASWLAAAPAMAQESTPPGPAPQTQPPAGAPPQQSYPPYAEQAPPPSPQTHPEQQAYPGQQPAPQYQQPTSNYAAAPPMPAADAPTFGSKFKFPDFSVRVDPLNWLLLGRLGIELEVEAFEWMTVEMVPVFVTTEEPVAMEKGLHQKSNGAGVLAGASLGVGFWLGGDSFNGTVLRAALTNYGYEYYGVSEVKQGSVEVGDRLSPIVQTERRLSFMLGSGRTWGAFTIGAGFGLEYEMNQQFSCVIRDANNSVYTGSQSRQRCKDSLGDDFDDSRQLVSLRPNTNRSADINSPFHPFSFAFRLSLGVAFDD